MPLIVYLQGVDDYLLAFQFSESNLRELIFIYLFSIIKKKKTSTYT